MRDFAVENGGNYKITDDPEYSLGECIGFMAKLFLDTTKEMGSAVSSDNENDFVKAKYKYQMMLNVLAWLWKYSEELRQKERFSEMMLRNISESYPKFGSPATSAVDSEKYVQMLKDLDEWVYKMDEREEADESSD